MKYWAVGIKGNIDDDFLDKKLWSTDYSKSNAEGLKHRKWIKDKMQIGDNVALKKIDRNKNSLTIFSLGTVLEKYDDYSGFKIDWNKEYPMKTTKSSYGQAKTIAQVLDKNAISDIFGISSNNYIEEVNNMNIKNIILYGSPGVGKTHNTKKLISLIESGKSDKEIFENIKNNEFTDVLDIDDIKDRVKFITFHQSFGYEDFIERFRPNEEGNIKLQDGIFKSICDDANNDRNNAYYLVIDEINRGNISKIFGELITLIEEDKRDTLEVILPYSKKPFKIPSNLYIIGTMNSTDKSIALIDIALRRRFTFLKMKPNLALVKNDKARDIMEKLNNMITDKLGADYVLGHSYFMKIQSDDDLDFVLEYKITPLLEEYFYGDKEGLDAILEILNEYI